MKIKFVLKAVLVIFVLCTFSLTACNCGGDTESSDPSEDSGDGSIGFFDDESSEEEEDDGYDLETLTNTKYFMSCNLDGNSCGCGGVITINNNKEFSYDGDECSFEDTITDQDWEELMIELYKENFFEIVAAECDRVGTGNSVAYNVELEGGESYSSNFYCDDPSNIDDIDQIISEMVQNYFPDASESWEYSD